MAGLFKKSNAKLKFDYAFHVGELLSETLRGSHERKRFRLCGLSAPLEELAAVDRSNGSFAFKQEPKDHDQRIVHRGEARLGTLKAFQQGDPAPLMFGLSEYPPSEGAEVRHSESERRRLTAG